MKIVKPTIILILIHISGLTISQNANVWLTYSQAKFVYSPGLEGNYFFHQNAGIQAGISGFILDNQPNLVANQNLAYSNWLYDINFDIVIRTIRYKPGIIGFAIGLKIYDGPEYKPLTRYNDYILYYESSHWNADYGIDFGLFYSFHKISCLLKFDTARMQARFGLGYAF